MYIFLLISLAIADDSEVEPNVIYKKETEIDFEALDLEGELVKPQGALLLERKRATFNPLIKLRSDWNQEMSDSVKDIK